MRVKIKHKYISQLLLIVLLSITTTTIFAQTESRTDNVSNAATNSINGNIYRNDCLSIGRQSKGIFELPTDVKLFVNGRIAKEFSGNIGNIGSNDLLSSWDKSFSPNASIPQVCGTLNQWGSSSFISGKNGKDSVVSWAGNSNRLDFDYINASFKPQTHMSILDNGNVSIGTAEPTEKLVIKGKGIFTKGNTGGTSTPILHLRNPKGNNSRANLLYLAGFSANNFGKIDSLGNGNGEEDCLEFRFCTLGDAVNQMTMGFRENGHLGINTSSPQCTFDVNGNICALSVSASSVRQHLQNKKDS